jgi:hypothetical protein
MVTPFKKYNKKEDESTSSFKTMLMISNIRYLVDHVISYLSLNMHQTDHPQ